MADTIVRVRQDQFEAAKDAAGMSYAQIADATGLPKSTVGKLGATTTNTDNLRIGLSKANRIAHVLKKDVTAIFTHTNGDRLCATTDSSSTAHS